MSTIRPDRALRQGIFPIWALVKMTIYGVSFPPPMMIQHVSEFTREHKLGGGRDRNKNFMFMSLGWDGGSEVCLKPKQEEGPSRVWC